MNSNEAGYCLTSWWRSIMQPNRQHETTHERHEGRRQKNKRRRTGAGAFTESRLQLNKKHLLHLKARWNMLPKDCEGEREHAQRTK